MVRSPHEQEFRAHFAARVLEFERENAALAAARRPVDLVAVGDSITDDSRPGRGLRRSDLPAEAMGLVLLNRGISGDRVHSVEGHGLGDRLGSLAPAQPGSPRHLTLLVGVNDLLQGYGPEDTLSRYMEVVTALRGRFTGATLHLFTLTRTHGPHAALDRLVERFNRGLRSLAGELGLDLREALTLESAGRPEECPDGLHPRLGGRIYRRYARELTSIAAG